MTPRLLYGVSQGIFPHGYKARSNFAAFGRRVKQQTMSGRRREVRVACLGVVTQLGWNCSQAVPSP